jgi:hypothetical protein
MLRGEIRDKEQLLKSLCAFAPTSHLLHIPTRIVAARSFLVAKCHAFSFLTLLAQDHAGYFRQLREVIFSIICTLMAEEVYFSCLEDPSFSEDIKRQLANDLISLWESGTDPHSVQYLPALEDLWAARDGAPPSFGTMDGSSELIRLSIDMGKDWHKFLVEQISHNETRWALEEFLFGLSFEEIQKVRSRLGRCGILAVGHEEVRSFLDKQPAYSIVRDSEPRAIYDFYIDRRDAALFRKRTQVPGPQKTLEEMYLKYCIPLAEADPYTDAGDVAVSLPGPSGAVLPEGALRRKAPRPVAVTRRSRRFPRRIRAATLSWVSLSMA